MVASEMRQRRLWLWRRRKKIGGHSGTKGRSTTMTGVTRVAPVFSILCLKNTHTQGAFRRFTSAGMTHYFLRGRLEPNVTHVTEYKAMPK